MNSLQFTDVTVHTDDNETAVQVVGRLRLFYELEFSKDEMHTEPDILERAEQYLRRHIATRIYGNLRATADGALQRLRQIVAPEHLAEVESLMIPLCVAGFEIEIPSIPDKPV